MCEDRDAPLTNVRRYVPAPGQAHKTLDQIIEEACNNFAVSAADLASVSRASSLVRARAWITHQAVTQRLASIAAVARLMRDESSLRHGLRRHFHHR
jgi:putative transposase